MSRIFLHSNPALMQMQKRQSVECPFTRAFFSALLLGLHVLSKLVWSIALTNVVDRRVVSSHSTTICINRTTSVYPTCRTCGSVCQTG